MNREDPIYELIFGLLFLGVSSYLLFLCASRAGIRKYIGFWKRYDRKVRGGPVGNLIGAALMAVGGILFLFRGISQWGEKDQQYLVDLFGGLCLLLFGIYGGVRHKEMARAGIRSSDRMADFVERHPWLLRIGVTIGCLGSIALIVESLTKLL